MWDDPFSGFLFMFGHFSSWVFIVVHTQRLLSVFWIPSTESIWTYLDFGVAEELSDFSCIACGIYIYNEMLQPDCNNLPNALPGALHCRWICPGKEGTCEPPVIDSWKSKSMSSTSCTWVCKCYQMLNLLLWVWHSMAYLVTLCLKPSSSAWKCQSIR